MRKKITYLLISVIIIIPIVYGYLYYTSFSEAEKISGLKIPLGAELVEKTKKADDFDGSNFLFFAIKLNDEEYQDLFEQCKKRKFKQGPVAPLTYSNEYVHKEDPVIFQLTNFDFPDYDLVVLNTKKRLLIVYRSEVNKSR